jgi:MinD-like ATPase involved in chromosome partitioning or flagellar assembly
VERALSLKTAFQVPSDAAVPQAVNRGVPVIVDNPRAPAARALDAIAEQLFRNEVHEAHAVEAVPEAVMPSRRRGRRRLFG